MARFGERNNNGALIIIKLEVLVSSSSKTLFALWSFGHKNAYSINVTSATTPEANNMFLIANLVEEIVYPA